MSANLQLLNVMGGFCGGGKWEAVGTEEGGGKVAAGLEHCLWVSVYLSDVCPHPWLWCQVWDLVVGQEVVCVPDINNTNWCSARNVKAVNQNWQPYSKFFGLTFWASLILLVSCWCMSGLTNKNSMHQMSVSIQQEMPTSFHPGGNTKRDCLPIGHFISCSQIITN